MKQLVKSNFFRLFKSKMIYVLFGIFAFVMIINVLLFNEGGSILGIKVFSAKYIMENNFATNLFVVIFIMLFLGTDFKNGAVRNKLIIGKSRTQLYLANLIVIEAVASAFYFAMVAISCISGFMVGFGGFSAGAYILSAFTGYALALCFASLYTFLNMSAASQGRGILYTLIVYFAADLLFSVLYIVAIVPSSGEFFTILLKIVPQGQVYYITASSMIDGFLLSMTNGLYWLFIGTSVGYCALFAVLGTLVFNKKDLK